MPLKLSDVTLICIDDVAHDLAELAISDTLERIDPGAVITWSSRPLTHRTGSYNVHAEPRSLAEVTNLLWYDVPTRVTTSHFLVVQWDGWVIDESRWDDAWLKRDYIGAPWGWHSDKRVGNGGFSLRSTALARWVARSGSYPITPGPEDDAICRTYRRRLEIDGFTWASDEEATKFAFERAAPRSSFGFHGCWHWPAILPSDRLAQRLAACNDYVKGKVEWPELMNAVAIRSALSSSPAMPTS